VICRDDGDDDDDDKSEKNFSTSSWKSRWAKVLSVVVRLCQLDEAGRRSVVVSGTPTTTWRFLRSNEAEASLHADARRLRETAAQEITRAGRANPPRPGVETARHGTSGTCVKNILSSMHPRSSRRFNFARATMQRSNHLKMSRRRGRYFKEGHVVFALFIEL